MKKIFAAAVLGVAALAFTGCASKHQEGVTSNLRTQSLTDGVTTDTVVTTEAAKAVLEAEGLKNVTANSTAVDGKATGVMANGKEVTVAIKKKEKVAGSDVWVTVGTIGDPALGAEIANKIKLKAEAK